MFKFVPSNKWLDRMDKIEEEYLMSESQYGVKMGKRSKVLRPSESIWEYMGGKITPLSIASAIADINGGFGISYSAKEVLKDLGLLTSKGNLTKESKELLAWYLHAKFHTNSIEVEVVCPI